MWIGILLLSILLGALAINGRVASHKELKRGWKFHRENKQSHSYSERVLDDWRTIEFESEWYSKNAARHVVYIPKNWANYPQWAQDRKEIILERLHQEFKPPTFTIIEIE